MARPVRPATASAAGRRRRRPESRARVQSAKERVQSAKERVQSAQSAQERSTDPLDALIAAADATATDAAPHAPTESSDQWHRLRARLHAQRNLGALADAVIQRSLHQEPAQGQGRQEAMVTTYLERPRSPAAAAPRRRPRSSPAQRRQREVEQQAKAQAKAQAAAKAKAAELEERRRATATATAAATAEPSPTKTKPNPKPKPQWRAPGRASAPRPPRPRPKSPPQQQAQAQAQKRPQKRDDPEDVHTLQQAGDKIIAQIERQKALLARLSGRWQAVSAEIEQRRGEIASVLANSPTADARLSAQQRMERHTALWEHRLNTARVRYNSAVSTSTELRKRVDDVREHIKDAAAERAGIEAASAGLEARKAQAQAALERNSRRRAAVEREVAAARAERGRAQDAFTEEARVLRLMIDAKEDSQLKGKAHLLAFRAPSAPPTPPEATANSPRRHSAMERLWKLARRRLSMSLADERAMDVETAFGRLQALSGAADADADAAGVTAFVVAQQEAEMERYDEARRLAAETAELEDEVAALTAQLRGIGDSSGAERKADLVATLDARLAEAAAAARAHRGKHDEWSAVLQAAEQPVERLMESLRWAGDDLIGLLPSSPTAAASSPEQPAPAPLRHHTLLQRLGVVEHGVAEALLRFIVAQTDDERVQKQAFVRLFDGQAGVEHTPASVDAAQLPSMRSRPTSASGSGPSASTVGRRQSRSPQRKAN